MEPYPLTRDQSIYLILLKKFKIPELCSKINNNFSFVPANEANFIIMTNRVVLDHNQVNEIPKLTNCFDKFKGSDISKVERNGLLLSVIRKTIN